VAKVLDFGIAKLPPTIDKDHGADADSPTLTIDRTREGLIVGTAAYMSPEQARGQAVDKRADIWAFGCLLYEMLTGRAAFARETITDTLAAVVEHEPDWTLLPAITPAVARRLLQRCLEKDVRRRQRDIGDVLHEIDEAQRTSTASPPSPVVEPQRKGRTRLVWSGLGAVCAIALVSPFLRPRDSPSANPLESAQFTRLTDFEGTELDPSISADGRFVAFLSDRDGPVDVWLTQVGTGEFRNLTAGRVPDLLNELVRNVGFSADGSRIWFRVAGANGRHDTWVMPTMGGTARPFLDRAVGAVWAEDGGQVAYHEYTPGDPMFIADRDGSNGRKIFVDRPGYHTHFLTWAPDSRFLYFARGLPVTGDMDVWRLAVSGGAPERITNHRSWVASPVALDDRTILYSAVAEDGSGPWLYAVDLNRRIPRRLSLGVEQYTSISATADGRRLVAAVTRPSGHLWTLPILNRPADEREAVQMDLMNVRAVNPRYVGDGLLYLSSHSEGDGLWLFKDGTSRELWKGSETGQISSPAVASGGSLSFTLRRNGRGTLYVMNADATDVRTLAESLNATGVPSWSPDARSIVVAANQGEGPRLFRVPIDGGAPIQLADEMATHPVWSPDGHLIVYSGPNISLQAPLKAVSPDGRPMALPPVTVRILGERYRFTPDGKGLVFMRGDWQNQQFHLIDLATGRERRLSNLKPGFTMRSFDVSPDGKQIVFDRVRENADLVLIDVRQQLPR
jgi:Tol biopolymer transport system component